MQLFTIYNMFVVSEKYPLVADAGMLTLQSFRLV